MTVYKYWTVMKCLDNKQTTIPTYNIGSLENLTDYAEQLMIQKPY